MARYLLNSAVLTGFGDWTYRPVSIEEAKSFVAYEFVCAIRYEPTAAKLSELLGVEIVANDVIVAMNKDDQALVIRPAKRLNKREVLAANQTDEIEWELGMLTRIH